MSETPAPQSHLVGEVGDLKDQRASLITRGIDPNLDHLPPRRATGMIDLPHRRGTSRVMGNRVFYCAKCRVNPVVDCEGQRQIDERHDGVITCFDCRTKELLDEDQNPPTQSILRAEHIEELRLAASAIRTYMPDTLPADEDGKIHFARALAEAAADAIEQSLATTEGSADGN